MIEASGGEEALAILKRYEAPFHLILTDVIMPGESGKNIADKILQLFPGIPVIFMSGYTDDAIVHHGVLDKNTNFIQKPFSIIALVQKIRNILDNTD